MRDEERMCGECHHNHKWGILRHSTDGVPLYGPRECDHWSGPLRGTGTKCRCDHFVAAVEGEENLPALTQHQTKALWSQTSFLNAQVPAATRIAISGIMQLLEVGSTNLDPAIAGAVREFMGLMVSQITDIRSALTKEDNKFAHLVAHTDEIVEAMKGVVQLKERLDTIHATQERILERLDDLAKPAHGVDENWNLPRPIDRESCDNCGHLYPLHQRGKCLGRTYREAPDCECHGFISRITMTHSSELMERCVTCGHPIEVHNLKVDITNEYSGPPHSDGCSLCPCTDLVTKASVTEAAHVFDSKSAPLWNEPITVASLTSEGEPDGE